MPPKKKKKGPDNFSAVIAGFDIDERKRANFRKRLATLGSTEERGMMARRELKRTNSKRKR